MVLLNFSNNPSAWGGVVNYTATLLWLYAVFFQFSHFKLSSSFFSPDYWLLGETDYLVKKVRLEESKSQLGKQRSLNRKAS